MYFLYPANEAVRRENNNLTNEVYLLIPVSEGDEIKKVRKRLEVETDALQAAFEEIEAGPNQEQNKILHNCHSK